MKDALNRKDELYNDLIDMYFNPNNLDFPKGSVDEDGGYFVQVLNHITVLFFSKQAIFLNNNTQPTFV